VSAVSWRRRWMLDPVEEYLLLLKDNPCGSVSVDDADLDEWTFERSREGTTR
jgi:hypothetical protein